MSLCISDIPEIKLNPKYKFKVRPHGATRLDRDGIAWEYKHGNGKIISVALPLEMILLNNKESYQKYPAFELYRLIGKDIVENNILCSTDSEVIITEHPENENTVYAIVCNCSLDKKQVTPKIKSGWKIDSIYSDLKEVKQENGIITMPNNCGALLVLKAD